MPTLNISLPPETITAIELRTIGKDGRGRGNTGPSAVVGGMLDALLWLTEDAGKEVRAQFSDAEWGFVLDCLRKIETFGNRLNIEMIDNFIRAGNLTGLDEKHGVNCWPVMDTVQKMSRLHKFTLADAAWLHWAEAARKEKENGAINQKAP